MAQTKLAILIESLYKGKGAKAAAKDMKGLEQQSGKTDSKIAQMRGGLNKFALAAGGVGVALVTAKKAFDFGKEGAQIKKIKDSFGALAGSVDSNSYAMLGSMRTATKSMVGDMDLMLAGNRFLAMGLAKSEAEAADLSRTAVILGSSMGKEAGPAMEEFALLLANQSIPRLDTFGISAGKVRNRIDELKTANKEMTRETAFMIAVQEEADVALTKVGDSVPVDSFTQLEVAIKNTTDAAKVSVADGLGPLIELLTKDLPRQQQLKSTKQALQALIGSGAEWKKLQKDIKWEAAGSLGLRDLTKETELYEKALEELLAEQAAEKAALAEISKAYANTDAKLGNLIYSTEGAGKALRELTDKEIKDAIKAGEEYEVVLDGIAGANFSGLVKVVETHINGLLDTAKNEAAAYNEELIKIALDGASAIERSFSGLANLATGTRDSIARIVATNINEMLKEAAANSDDLAESLGALPDTGWSEAMQEKWFDNEMAAVSVREELEHYIQELDSLNGMSVDTFINVRYREHGKPSRGDVGGEYDYPNVPPPSDDYTPWDPKDTPGYQRGANFIVPPGYPNDSFPMRVQSGEHVTVTPRGRGRGRRTPTIFNQYLIIRGGGNPAFIGKQAAKAARNTIGSFGDQTRG